MGLSHLRLRIMIRQNLVRQLSKTRGAYMASSNHSVENYLSVAAAVTPQQP